MHRSRTTIVLRLTAAVLVASAPTVISRAQANQTPASFEAATIKRNRSGTDFAEGGFQPGGRITARNVTLFGLITAAYATAKIDGGPAWTRTDRFDVAAVGNRSASVAETRQMLRALLAERFKLVTRVEMREEPIFALTLVRQDRQLGPQLKPAPDCTAAQRETLPPPTTGPDLNHPPCGAIAFGGGVYRGHGVTVDQIAGALAGQVDRPVTNRTSLEGLYDCEVWFSRPSESSNPTEPPGIFTAVREQLGLQFQQARGPVEYLVLVSAQQPQVDE
jgi:uncharacterized protein (TIGR03435 family)